MKEKYRTCRHAKSIGQVAVFVEPTCRHCHLIRGVLVTSKKTCNSCKGWEKK